MEANDKVIYISLNVPYNVNNPYVTNLELRSIGFTFGEKKFSFIQQIFDKSFDTRLGEAIVPLLIKCSLEWE